MRPQANQVQETGEQKKSVFDRLGRQLDTRSVNRGSPVNYGEHPMHHMMHDPEFGRYGRGDQHPDMNWRYENDRRHMAIVRERHQPPNPGQYPPPFDMNMPPGRQQLQYFPGPSHHHPQYHPNPAGPPPGPLMGPEVLAMEMHQRRPSPKYDRHGNPIRGAVRMEHLPPSENYMGPPPGPMLPPPGYDMPPMGPGMYQQPHWHDNLDMNHAMHARIQQDGRFIDPHRYPPHQPKPPIIMNPDIPAQSNLEAPRYSKWRERRDVITNLDRQTAQSSSKTDSLKSSLQQPDTKNHSRRGNNKDNRQAKIEAAAKKQASPKKEPGSSTNAVAKVKQSATSKDEPTEISDGEIVDDEDSSDDSDVQKQFQDKDESDQIVDNSNMPRKTPYGRIASQEQQYYERKKRRRLLDRDDYPMDYETISDEELDDFISDKKLVDEAKLDGSVGGKSSSEIELLNALGLDWANLIELSKQSKKEAPTSGSALRRFSIPSYLPTLGITRELAGPEIYNFILKVCQ